MTVLTEPRYLGDVLKYEAPNLYSRDQVTVAAGQQLILGTVVGRVTATGKFKQLDPAATDGSEAAAGILIVDVDATLIDVDEGLIVARHGIVAAATVVWPDGITAEQKIAALAQLKSLGILVRQGA